MIRRLFFLSLVALLALLLLLPGCSSLGNVQGTLSSICPVVRSLARTAEALCALSADTAASPETLTALNLELRETSQKLYKAVEDLTAVRMAQRKTLMQGSEPVEKH
jgi:hypothetical protein